MNLENVQTEQNMDNEFAYLTLTNANQTLRREIQSHTMGITPFINKY